MELNYLWKQESFNILVRAIWYVVVIKKNNYHNLTIIGNFNFFLMEHGSYQNEKKRYEENSEFSDIFWIFYFNLTVRNLHNCTLHAISEDKMVN